MERERMDERKRGGERDTELLNDLTVCGRTFEPREEWPAEAAGSPFSECAGRDDGHSGTMSASTV